MHCIRDRLNKVLSHTRILIKLLYTISQVHSCTLAHIIHCYMVSSVSIIPVSLHTDYSVHDISHVFILFKCIIRIQLQLRCRIFFFFSMNSNALCHNFIRLESKNLSEAIQILHFTKCSGIENILLPFKLIATAVSTQVMSPQIHCQTSNVQHSLKL